MLWNGSTSNHIEGKICEMANRKVEKQLLRTDDATAKQNKEVNER